MNEEKAKELKAGASEMLRECMALVEKVADTRPEELPEVIKALEELTAHPEPVEISKMKGGENMEKIKWYKPTKAEREEAARMTEEILKELENEETEN